MCETERDRKKKRRGEDRERRGLTYKQKCILKRKEKKGGHKRYFKASASSYHGNLRMWVEIYMSPLFQQRDSK